MSLAAPILILSLFSATHATHDRLTPEEVRRGRAAIESMRSNRRGPYAGVMWYCKDGQVLPPKPYACKEFGGGKQYGVYSADTKWLAARGIYIGTILTALPPTALIDNNYYRTRALILEYYLERVLDGWSLKAAKSYRGFRQVEDEQEAARFLLIELMRKKKVFRDHRSLAVRATRALPYGRTGSLADEIRALAGVIGDADEDFAELRFKIHAMPEPRDIDGVRAYIATKGADSVLAEQARELVGKMTTYYNPASRVARLKEVRRWIWHAGCKKLIADFVAIDPSNTLKLLRDGTALMGYAADLLAETYNPKQGERNLLLLHTMALVEELWVAVVAPLAEVELSREEGMQLLKTLLKAAGHLGMLSSRELEMVYQDLEGATASTAAYVAAIDRLSRVLMWARARVLADLGLALPRYRSLEPKTAHVVDDILRSGVMLPLAGLIDRLSRDAESLQTGGHQLRGLNVRGARVRGENPGLAQAELRSVASGGDLSTLRREHIALLYELPPDLPPVAGLLTVGSTGSLSHVALLARNLGIPHASIDSAVAAALQSLNGQRIVLGVTQHKRVLLGAESSFPELVTGPSVSSRAATPNAGAFTIDAEKLDLKFTALRHLDEISHLDSGVRLGPKAAELGRLRKLFPDRVSDAVLIPFGAFYAHVNRAPAGGAVSPLEHLRRAYAQAALKPLAEREPFLLAELSTFRTHIAELPFVHGFADEVTAALRRLGRPNTFGVFVRSDTNVEDLKNFTGAGLNKTVANVVGTEKILKAVKQVWASPFSARSFRWRQKLLKNPEHVYPSVILHRTVPSEISGVLVTTDIEGRAQNAITVSASEGVAAVVDGGSPETIVIERGSPGAVPKALKVRLLASSRSASRKVIPRPPRGGVILTSTIGQDPLLSDADIAELSHLAQEVEQKIPRRDGLPWDIEFGLVKHKAWLMQIRPLRTSKAAAQHPFLLGVDRNAAQSDRELDLKGLLPKL